MSDPSHVHNRQSIRLKGYDYSQAGAYFITICTQGRECLFGQVVDGEMHLSEIGQIAQKQWNQIPARFENVELGPFVVMPNHHHGILIVRAGLAPALGQPQGLPLPKTIGDIVGAYKSLVANECIKIFKTKNQFMGKLWQRNYYEHIIRDEQSYQNIAAYILNNPRQWEADRLFKAE